MQFNVILVFILVSVIVPVSALAPVATPLEAVAREVPEVEAEPSQQYRNNVGKKAVKVFSTKIEAAGKSIEERPNWVNCVVIGCTYIIPGGFVDIFVTVVYVPNGSLFMTIVWAESSA
ncbi:hypothetical protein PQX77_018236 [Marasmius sp. AFHP31]|nr:hypothetical protein PQX77_018236 [Marasmius sp. AFHP31]